MICLYILHKVEIRTGVTNAWLTHSLTDWQTLKDRAIQLLIKYKSGALVMQLRYYWLQMDFSNRSDDIKAGYQQKEKQWKKRRGMFDWLRKKKDAFFFTGVTISRQDPGATQAHLASRLALTLEMMIVTNKHKKWYCNCWKSSLGNYLL